LSRGPVAREAIQQILAECRKLGLNMQELLPLVSSATSGVT